MREVRRSAVVPYSSQEMFDLVNDIPSYPDFLTWCYKSAVHRQEEGEIEASLGLSHGSLKGEFTTINRLTPHDEIRIDLVGGPFRHLEGRWLFETLDEQACEVGVEMRFEFASPITGLLFNAIFEQIVGSLVDAFSERARQVYGPR
jgi:ribosome-associated toxin RatA of RatAB toxin-antitoxin module